MLNPKFIHLRVHSDYSLVDGLASPIKLVNYVNKLKMPSIAITDVNNFHGIIKFYKQAYKLGIKPIIGMDLFCYSKIMKNELYKITLLAKNNNGYNNLIMLISKAYKKRFNVFNKVLIKQSWLKKYSKGLILLSGGVYGDIGKNLINKNYKNLSLCFEFYKKYFDNSFYIEIMKTGRNNELLYLYNILKFSVSYKVPVVATNDVCFLKKNDFYLHKIRVAINKSCTINNLNLKYNYTEQQYMRSEKEMCELFSEIPISLKNSVEIAKRCNVTLNLGKYFLPNFLKKKKKSYKYLKKISIKGLKRRLKNIYFNKKNYLKKKKKYINRLFYELHIIKKMGFPDYFLIVMEFIKWAKKKKIPVGPGRGSGAGSLVAYSLNITDLNPLKYKLLFERFLNPDRISMPDFDIDFCMERRDEVINHVIKRYGRHSVAQIITFGKLTAKAVIRDVGRVLGYPYGFINNISKLIPLDFGVTLKNVLSKDALFFNLYNNDNEVKKIIDIAKKLEGVIRNIGKHAGGLVISPTKITDFVPLYCSEFGNNLLTQFDKSDIENIGLVKFDFLGLRTLTTMNRSIQMINKKNKFIKKNKISLSGISLLDSKSFALLRKGNTVGVFQLESLGIRNLIKKLKPSFFEDIVSLLALFRPGPLKSGMVDNFINRKNGNEVIFYPDKKWQHLSLKPILKSTYGIILYQEQVMQIAQILSGFTLGRADILRRAMEKKNIKYMNKQRKFFEKGAYKNGINKEISLNIFNLLEKFSGYGFNKSHSVAYALISYQTLWLKANYPSEYIASVMTSEMYNIDKLINLIEEANRMKIKILSPNINKSKYFFDVNCKGYIIYGLGAIKGIGKNSIYYILNERKKSGIFINFLDFIERIDKKKITKKILEKMIYAGVFDCFKLERFILKNNLNFYFKLSNQHLENKINKQKSLFYKDNIFLKYNVDEIFNQKVIWSKKEKLNLERKVLGFYLTDNPINKYFKKKYLYNKITRIKNINFSCLNKKIYIIGMVSIIKIKITKNKKKIALITINDNLDKILVVFYSKIFKKYEFLLQKDKIINFFGTLKLNNFTNDFNLIIISCKIMN
ncbi:DNA polymerase III subunit alpha [Buchnera aphidicola]|uniref:DNA polymerase III subunit alpha n=1 Tax=Buchnera aphidicola TaxID=9 RepID=UPI0031B866E9